jgi:putative ABC transport system permease protein
MLISALDRKLMRDLWHMKGQVLAISLVMACGVAVCVMALGMLHSLQTSLDRFYSEYRFADVFASLKRAPISLAERIAEIPGVSRVDQRIVYYVTRDIPGFDEPVIGLIVSIPENHPPVLNDLYLTSGALPQPGRDDEAVVNQSFAEAHHMTIGDSFTAVINGRRQKIIICGTALSPEFVYTIGPGSLFPDDMRFGVMWMSRKAVENAFDLKGAFNNVTLSLARGANEAEVIDRLDDLIRPYGGTGAYGRKDQVSNFFISGEFEQLRAMAIIAPAIFLAVSAFLLNIVLSRIISLERDQIGVLKAFGYSNAAIAFHYLKVAVVVGIVGSILGVALGAWTGSGLANIYARFYHLPNIAYALRPDVISIGVLSTLGAAVIGILGAIHKAVTLPPAEAMRPPTPAVYRRTLLERLGLERLFTQPSRMIVRHIERHLGRSALSSFGIAVAIAILIASSFSLDSIDYIIQVQFNVSQRQDVSVGFFEARPLDAMYAVEHLPGVLRVEPYRSVAARLRNGHFSRRVGITGVRPGDDLNRQIDANLHDVPTPETGIMLSKKLASLLHVGRGDRLTVEVMEGRRPVRDIPVSGVYEEFVGTSAVMNMSALNALMGEGPSISGVYATVDSRQDEKLYSTLKNIPVVSAVLLRAASLQSFRDTMAENLTQTMIFNIMFAGLIAIGVVYNTARISLSERARELASLRVLGLTRGEISYILLGELTILTVAAMPVGCLLGRFLSWLLSMALNTDLYRIPLIINPSTYGMAVMIVLIASVASGLIVRHRLDHLDLVAVLKTRE